MAAWNLARMVLHPLIASSEFPPLARPGPPEGLHHDTCHCPEFTAKTDQTPLAGFGKAQPDRVWRRRKALKGHSRRDACFPVRSP